MTKQTGLGDNLYVAGFDLSGDVGSLGSISTPRGITEVTGIDKSAFERTLTHRDGNIEYNAWFNPASDQAHERLSALPTTDQILTYCRGTTLGNPAAAMVAKQLNYDGSRNTDGSFSFTTSAQANGYGLEWGVQLTAGIRTDSSATNGTSVDLGSASPGAFGLQAYLHVFSVTGTSVTVKLQESSDNDPGGEGDEFADVVGGAFTAATPGGSPTSQRIATGAIDVERYLRVVTTGTFSDAQFAVTVIRNPFEVSF